MFSSSQNQNFLTILCFSLFHCCNAFCSFRWCFNEDFLEDQFRGKTQNLQKMHILSNWKVKTIILIEKKYFQRFAKEKIQHKINFCFSKKSILVGKKLRCWPKQKHNFLFKSLLTKNRYKTNSFPQLFLAAFCVCNFIFFFFERCFVDSVFHKTFFVFFIPNQWITGKLTLSSKDHVFFLLDWDNVTIDDTCPQKVVRSHLKNSPKTHLLLFVWVACLSNIEKFLISD